MQQNVSPLIFFFFLFLSTCQWLLHRTGKTGNKISMKLHMYLWVDGEVLIEIFVAFQGHNHVKSRFGPYLDSCWWNCHQCLTQGSLGRGLWINLKYKHLEWIEHKMHWNALHWAPFCYKKNPTSLTITFELKQLNRMTILVPRSMFLRPMNPMLPFVLT